ncbi:cytochrome P450 3A8-like [Palaemon carinicauda]|uniref:cytochrome P450 3A8-like n=1 Tax=Palaemon carinicauda TaxID=392227 RepID=UPI0035B68700
MLITLALVALLVTSIWLYSKHRLSYWAKLGIPSPPALPFFGNLFDLILEKRGRWVFEEKVYRKYTKGGLSGAYMFMWPILYISDPEWIKQILVKDFDHFSERQTFTSLNENDRPMNESIFNANGEKWKKLRSLMSPTFTSGKMKHMFHLVCEKADALGVFCLKEATTKRFVNIKKACGRFTIDTIASCAFGLECNSFEDENAVFPAKVQTFFEFSYLRMLKIMLVMIMPFIGKFIDVGVFPEEKLFFQNVAEQTLAARRKENKRGDFLDLLLEAQASEEKDSEDQTKPKVLNDLTIIAQSMLFIVVGYDTTSTAIAMTSFLLSKSPGIQQRLRQELQEVVEKEGVLTYQGIMEAKFLDACIMEALRLYPPSPILERVCSKDYQVPGTNITVRKGDLVEVPLWSIHHDEKYWPEPEVFNPDRFMPENKADILPYTHIPFGCGPRNCIAMRFALMEAKVALSKLVLSFDMKTAPRFDNIELAAGGFLLMPKAVNLTLKPLRDEWNLLGQSVECCDTDVLPDRHLSDL